QRSRYTSVIKALCNQCLRVTSASVQPADPRNRYNVRLPAASVWAAMKHIGIRGARTHNLKNIDLSLPRDRLIVITGLSGSGKSSLAFDTLYAEGQRRYVESLS